MSPDPLRAGGVWGRDKETSASPKAPPPMKSKAGRGLVDCCVQALLTIVVPGAVQVVVSRRVGELLWVQTGEDL